MPAYPIGGTDMALADAALRAHPKAEMTVFPRLAP